MYDPQSLILRQDILYEARQGYSTSASRSAYYASGSRILTVKFGLEGIDFGQYVLSSVISREREDVNKRLALFERLCQRINGSTHQPAYLRLDWSQASVRSTFEARLKSYEINHDVIDRNNKPLLASISATFVEAAHPQKQQARQRLSSPDLTHRHLVKAGDTLPMLCMLYYGSTAPCLQVAAFNDLDEIRCLTLGRELLFPPLVSTGGEA